MQSSVLAKILMVTKLSMKTSMPTVSSVLAKILMVTKLCIYGALRTTGSVLAKILMVTKPRYSNTVLCKVLF